MTVVLGILAVWLIVGITLAGLVVVAAPWLPTVPLPPEPEPDPDPLVAMLDDDYDEDDDPRLRVVWNEVVEYYRGQRAVSQSRTWSFIESWTNVAVGFGVNFVANLTILPWFGFAIKPGQALSMGAIFTVISVARSYVLRRVFNRVGK